LNAGRKPYLRFELNAESWGMIIEPFYDLRIVCHKLQRIGGSRSAESNNRLSSCFDVGTRIQDFLENGQRLVNLDSRKRSCQ
jgi:hypothetical protein